MRKLLFLVIALIPLTAWSQTGVEITPFGGYRWGGTISEGTTDLFHNDVDVADNGSYGVLLDIPISRGVQLEFMANRQESYLQTNDDLFEPEHRIADIDLTYWHAGILWEADRRDVTPYLVFSLGATDLNLDIPGTESETRFSGSIGGGVKVFVNRHFGFRFEGRGYWTDLHDNSHNDCHGCYDDYYYYNNDLYQGEVLAGVLFAF